MLQYKIAPKIMGGGMVVPLPYQIRGNNFYGKTSHICQFLFSVAFVYRFYLQLRGKSHNICNGKIVPHEKLLGWFPPLVVWGLITARGAQKLGGGSWNFTQRKGEAHENIGQLQGKGLIFFLNDFLFGNKSPLFSTIKNSQKCRVFCNMIQASRGRVLKSTSTLRGGSQKWRACRWKYFAPPCSN